MSTLDEGPAYEFISGLINLNYSNRQIAERVSESYFPTSEKSIRRWKKRHISPQISLQAPSPSSVSYSENEAEITTSPTFNSKISDPNQMIRERGLSVSDWVVDHVVANEWSSPSGQPLYQTKLSLKRVKGRSDQILPARPEGLVFAKPAKLDHSKTIQGIAVSDHHAPYQNAHLHECVLAFLEDYQLDQIAILGDLVDCPDVSRHRFNPAFKASTQRCVDEGYKIIRDYRKVAPNATMQFIEGNHSARLRNYIIDNAREIYGLKPGSDEEEELRPSLSLASLLRFDELQIEYEDTDETYEYKMIKLSPKLGAIHGTKPTNGGGNTVRRAIEKYNHSLLQADTHRQAIIQKTTYSIDQEPEVHLGAEIGCLCKIDKGLGYSKHSDWQNGFCFYSLYPDGTFRVELATYLKGALYFRDKRYS